MLVMCVLMIFLGYFSNVQFTHDVKIAVWYEGTIMGWIHLGQCSCRPGVAVARPRGMCPYVYDDIVEEI